MNAVQFCAVQTYLKCCATKEQLQERQQQEAELLSSNVEKRRFVDDCVDDMSKRLQDRNN